MRGSWALAIVVHASVDGSHISAANTGVPALLKPGPLVPPVARTLPSGRIAELSCRRGNCIEETWRQTGLDWLRSMTSAVAVGGSLPPATRIRPGPYITDEP